MSKAFFVGEQVAFLNQKGGGVVTKIEQGQIWVQDQTGFEIPFPPNELIKIRQPNGLFMDVQHHDSGSYQPYPTSRDVWLIWEPESPETGTHGTMRVGNASSFDLTLVLLGKYKGKFKRLWSGFIPLGQVSEPIAWRADDTEWLRQFLVECIPSLLVPHSFQDVVNVHLATPKTFGTPKKEDLFLHPFSTKPAWVVNFNLVKEDVQTPAILPTEIGSAVPKPVRKAPLPRTQHRVVDLHADILWKIPPPPKEVLIGQIEALHHEMSYCLQHQIERLTVIHGIGEGKLKAAVRKELSQYQNIKIEEANAAYYGFGALTITFEC